MTDLQGWNHPPPSTTNPYNDEIGNPDPPLKRHAACDECRKRKLKCSGEATGCSRCVKQSLFCHYSIQKQMGRPPKKRMREDDELGAFGRGGNDIWIDPDTNHFTAAATSEAFQVCPPVYCASMAKQPPAFPQETAGNEPSISWESGPFRSLNPIEPTASPWPDFSTVSAAASNPFPMLGGIPDMNSLPMSPPDSMASEPTAQCSCLSYLYLCLSHLSSLSSFPITKHTLCSLSIAARTASGIIRCPNCPKRFATGVQNIMCTGTLLNVIADSWLRVSKADAVELGKQAATSAYIASVLQSSPDQTQSWKEWLRSIVRHGVIGGPFDPTALDQCSQFPDLLSLIKEMEARQRKWHSGEDQHPLQKYRQDPDDGSSCRTPATDDSSHHNHDHPDSEEANRECEEKDFLCLRVAGSAREVISKFKFEPHEYPDGVVS